MPNKWQWPEPPFATPHDAIACYFRSWGAKLASKEADELIQFLSKNGWYFCQALQEARSADTR